MGELSVDWDGDDDDDDGGDGGKSVANLG